MGALGLQKQGLKTTKLFTVLREDLFLTASKLPSRKLICSLYKSRQASLYIGDSFQQEGCLKRVHGITFALVFSRISDVFLEE